jgi:hypothetical protein
LQRDGYFVQLGAHIRGGGAELGTVVVPGVGACDGVAEVAFDPGQGGVAQPVGGDALGGNPGQVLADSLPETVVAVPRDRSSIAVAQELIVLIEGYSQAIL